MTFTFGGGLFPDGSNVTVMEDAESGTVADRYDGQTGSFEFADDASLEGSRLLTQTSTSDFQTIGGAVPDLDTPRGYRYKCRTKSSVSGSWAILLGSQDSTDARNNTYIFIINISGNSIQIAKYTDGSFSALNSTSTEALSTGTEYRMRIDYDETGVTDNVSYELLDANDDLLGDGGGSTATIAASDDTHTGGSFGVYGDSASEGLDIDYVTRRPL